MQFTETEIYKLFGHEAAENEDPQRLAEYYFKNHIYNQVVNDIPLRIVVGHKGIGKSALFKVAMIEESKANRLTILIKPDDIIDIGENETDFLKLIRAWKIGITEIIAEKALQNLGVPLEESWKKTLGNLGGKAIDFLTKTLQPANNKVDLDPSKELVVNNFLKTAKISVYMDDLDRGWQGREQDIRRISALLNAVRDISTDNNGIYFRIALRSDVYFLARTSDESTDKIEGSVIWFSWDNHQILALLAKRVESYFGNIIDGADLIKKDQHQLMNHLQKVMEPRFEGKGHWSNAPMYQILMSLVRKRPRDLVKLLVLAGRVAYQENAEKIGTVHLESIFEDYSQSRLQDTINEYKSELPDIERLLLGMKPNKHQKRASQNYTYTHSELLKKIKNIREQGVFRWANDKIATEQELAGFLYKINFITARKVLDNNIIERKYFEENRYLSNKFTDFGYDWEVHPAYRWALQPENILDILNEVSQMSIKN